MFGSDVLDIAVGLVLVFLMMSIIMTAVQEAVEGWLKARATHLEEALLQLMQGDQQMLARFYAHPLIYALYRDADPIGRGKGPTYIPREAFSAALVDMIEQPEAPVPEKLLAAYDGL